MHIDAVLQEIGEGLAQRSVLICMSLVTFLHGFMVTGFVFFLPQIACDMNQPWSHLLFFFLPFLIGLIAGTYWFGCMSDISGRIEALSFASTTAFAVSFVASTSTAMFVTDISFCILGFSLAGIHLGCRVLLFEILPSKCRRSRVICLELIAAIGSTLAIAMAHILLNESVLSASPFRLRSWRLILVLFGFFSVIGAAIVQEASFSPRQMIAHLRVVSASIILRKYYAINNSVNEHHYLNYHLQPFKYYETHRYIRRRWVDYVVFYLKSICRYTSHIIEEPFVKPAFLLMPMYLCFFDGSLLLKMLISTRVELDSKLCQLNGISSVNESQLHDICFRKSPPLFLSNLFIECGIVITLSLLTLTIDHCSRNWVFVIACVTSSCGTLLCSFDISTEWLYVAAFFSTAGNSVAMAILNIMTLECFPTKFRCTAFGVMTLWGRLALIAVMSLTKASCSHVLFYFGLVFLGATIFPFFLPRIENGILLE